MVQNRSHAVMAQRSEPHDSLDFFPTPAWATRALIEHVMIGGGWRLDQIKEMDVHECACGQGHMAKPLSEYFKSVLASDCHDYGFGRTHDFLMPGKPLGKTEWIITNPPFKLGAEFILRALEIARVGVAMLVRTSFIESVSRYENIFSRRAPLYVAPFVERVPMFKGRVDPSGSTATSYCWLVWATSNDRPFFCETHIKWIPPCRKMLERDHDYFPLAPEVP